MAPAPRQLVLLGRIAFLAADAEAFLRHDRYDDLLTVEEQRLRTALEETAALLERSPGHSRLRDVIESYPSSGT